MLLPRNQSEFGTLANRRCETPSQTRSAVGRLNSVTESGARTAPTGTSTRTTLLERLKSSESLVTLATNGSTPGRRVWRLTSTLALAPGAIAPSEATTPPPESVTEPTLEVPERNEEF